MNTIFCAHFFSCADVDCSRYLGVLRRRDTKTLTHLMSTHKHKMPTTIQQNPSNSKCIWIFGWYFCDFAAVRCGSKRSQLLINNLWYRFDVTMGTCANFYYVLKNEIIFFLSFSFISFFARIRLECFIIIVLRSLVRSTIHFVLSALGTAQEEDTRARMVGIIETVEYTWTNSLASWFIAATLLLRFFVLLHTRAWVEW